MKYSGEKLFYEITAFVKIYRDEIKTNQFKELARKSKTVSAKSELKKLRELHRELEEEIMDYYNKQKGMRIGVILDPAAVGLDVGQLQSILNPEMAFNAGGQTVTELAQAQDNPVGLSGRNANGGGRQGLTQRTGTAGRDFWAGIPARRGIVRGFSRFAQTVSPTAKWPMCPCAPSAPTCGHTV